MIFVCFTIFRGFAGRLFNGCALSVFGVGKKFDASRKSVTASPCAAFHCVCRWFSSSLGKCRQLTDKFFQWLTGLAAAYANEAV